MIKNYNSKYVFKTHLPMEEVDSTLEFPLSITSVFFDYGEDKIACLRERFPKAVIPAFKDYNYYDRLYQALEKYESLFIDDPKFDYPYISCIENGPMIMFARIYPTICHIKCNIENRVSYGPPLEQVRIGIDERICYHYIPEMGSFTYGNVRAARKLKTRVCRAANECSNEYGRFGIFIMSHEGKHLQILGGPKQDSKGRLLNNMEHPQLLKSIPPDHEFKAVPSSRIDSIYFSADEIELLTKAGALQII